MVWRNAGGICERKTLFQMKKEVDQAGFKGTQTGPIFAYQGSDLMTLKSVSSHSESLIAVP